MTRNGNIAFHLTFLIVCAILFKENVSRDFPLLFFSSNNHIWYTDSRFENFRVWLRIPEDIRQSRLDISVNDTADTMDSGVIDATEPGFL
jgi:hypothetical protein